ncbi:MAG: YfbM family protein [Chloroflexaceae bacterium]|nr:YfbM family protein [Chloroflexaceae bacterium]
MGIAMYFERVSPSRFLPLIDSYDEYRLAQLLSNPCIDEAEEQLQCVCLDKIWPMLQRTYAHAPSHGEVLATLIDGGTPVLPHRTGIGAPYYFLPTQVQEFSILLSAVVEEDFFISLQHASPGSDEHGEEAHFAEVLVTYHHKMVRFFHHVAHADEMVVTYQL